MKKSSIKTYTVKNLDCAHCAAKIEKAISQMKEVEQVTLTFTTRKLQIKAVHTKDLFDKIAKKCDRIEPGVLICEEENTHSKTVNDNHNHDCCCHENHHPHTHEEEKHKKKSENSIIDHKLITIIVGVILMITAKISENITDIHIISVSVYILSYIVSGSGILVSAFRSICRGKIFNEKFLMSLATLAAIFLKDYPEAVGVMLFFRIGEYFENKAVEKSRKSIMSVVNMRPETANVVCGDRITETKAEDIKPGQIILVRVGERIPLDGTVINGESCLDTSSLTGEHMPVNIQKGDSVLSGCINLQQTLKIEVTKPLEDSTITRIIHSIENAAAGKPEIDRFISRFASVYTPVVVALAFLTAVIPSLITGQWHKWIYTAVTFLVISCPCAVVLSVPLTFFAGIGAASKKGILFKNALSIEKLVNVRTVIMDKTGTITTGTFSAEEIELYNNISENELIKLCASCEMHSSHPIAQSLVNIAEERKITLDAPEFLNEFAGMGIEATISGKKILCGNESLMKKYNIDISDYKKEKSGTDIICAVDGKVAGCFRINDTIKNNSKEVIKRLEKSECLSVMLTGDSESSASAVAEKTGIKEFYAELLPDQKLEKMKSLREKYGSVMFIGDGINDAPVLAGADVSVAMGSGADTAIEVADIVFMNNDIGSTVLSFEIANSTYKTALCNIFFALLFKLAVMILGFIGFADMWFAVFADSGVAVLCVLNSIRLLRKQWFK